MGIKVQNLRIGRIMFVEILNSTNVSRIRKYPLVFKESFEINPGEKGYITTTHIKLPFEHTKDGASVNNDTRLTMGNLYAATEGRKKDIANKYKVVDGVGIRLTPLKEKE